MLAGGGCIAMGAGIKEQVLVYSSGYGAAVLCLDRDYYYDSTAGVCQAVTPTTGVAHCLLFNVTCVSCIPGYYLSSPSCLLC